MIDLLRDLIELLSWPQHWWINVKWYWNLLYSWEISIFVLLFSSFFGCTAQRLCSMINGIGHSSYNCFSLDLTLLGNKKKKIGILTRDRNSYFQPLMCRNAQMFWHLQLFTHLQLGFWTNFNLNAKGEFTSEQQWRLSLFYLLRCTSQ